MRLLLALICGIFGHIWKRDYWRGCPVKKCIRCNLHRLQGWRNDEHFDI